jgi:hypothetical protein
MKCSRTTAATTALLAAAAVLVAGCLGKKDYDEVRYYRSVQREPGGTTSGVGEITRKQAATQEHWRFYISGGRAERMEHYNAAGELASEVRLGFDAEGRVADERTYSPDKRLLTKLEIAYDDTGRVTGFKHYTAEAGLIEERSWRYDSRDRLAEVRVNGRGGILRWRDEFVYDARQPAKWLGVRRYDRTGKLLEQFRAQDYTFWE